MCVYIHHITNVWVVLCLVLYVEHSWTLTASSRAAPQSLQSLTSPVYVTYDTRATRAQ